MPGERDDSALDSNPTRRRVFFVGAGVFAAAGAVSVVALVMEWDVGLAVVALGLAFWTVATWLYARRQ